MSFLTVALCCIFSCALGIYIGVKLDQEYGPNNVTPECVGSIIIYNQDEEAYLFLDTALSPGELAEHSTATFNVETATYNDETQDPQLPL